MKKEDVSFYSDTHKLDGSFYYPETKVSKSKPILVICSGYTGLKSIHPERFARAFTQKGYICFGFDYRGFGKSKGPRNRIVMEDQVKDIENACIYVTEINRQTKGRKIILIGWGMGAGLVLEAVEIIPHVKKLVCINGFYDGWKWQEQIRGKKKMNDFRKWLLRNRLSEIKTGKKKKVDPFILYPLPEEVTKSYVDNVLRKYSGYGGKVGIQFGQSLLHFSPISQVTNKRFFKKLPLLILHGDKNKLHPKREAIDLFKVYPGPKQLHLIKGVGHTEWMLDDHPKFLELINYLNNWM